MFRKSIFTFTPSIRGRPWKKRNTFHPIHASERPAEPADINFLELDLKYSPSHQPENFISKIGWSKPPSVKPDLPFQVGNISQFLIYFLISNF
jgi:hypothetical protein